MTATIGPVAVLRAYNEVMVEGGLPTVKMRRTPRKGEKQALYDQLTAFWVWCVARDVDPKRWIRARHEAIGFKRRLPVWKLRSEKFLIKFRHFGDEKQAAAEEQLRAAARAVDDVDWGGAELRHLWEAMKQVIAGTVECAVDTDLTGGWNPCSKWCRDCVIAVECRDALPEAVQRARSK